MKVIFTECLRKTSKYHYDRGPSVDDQPNFINRDKQQEGDVMFLDYNEGPESATTIKKRWNKKKTKDKKDLIEEEMPKGSL